MSSSKKVRFSNVISTVRFERGLLKIRQLRLVALAFMALFLGVLIWLGLDRMGDLPWFVIGCLLFTGVFLVWGIVDVLTTRVSFSFRPASDYLEVKARRKSFRLNYKGTGKERLSLTVQRHAKDKANRSRYCVILNYSDQDCHIPFALTGSFLEESKAKSELEAWAEKLSL